MYFGSFGGAAVGCQLRCDVGRAQDMVAVVLA